MSPPFPHSSVVVDFSLYNQDTNLLSVVRMIVELPPDGFLLPR